MLKQLTLEKKGPNKLKEKNLIQRRHEEDVQGPQGTHDF